MAILNKEKTRIEWVDIAKAIAIILMIVGHEVSSLHLHALIFSFHMPLFFILSGYTSSHIDSWAKVTSKVKKYFIKVWLLAVVMIVLLGIENLIFNSSVHFNNMAQSVEQGIFWGSNIPGLFSVGVMWFLFVYFWSRTFFYLMQMIFKKQYVIGIILAILSTISMIWCQGFKHWLPQSLDIVPIATLFMWMGFIFRNCIDKGISLKFLSLIALMLGSLWVFCVFHAVYIELEIRHYPYYFVSIFEALGGTFLFCLISKWLASFTFLKKISIIGQHTLAVMCIHHLDLYWILWDRFINSWQLAAVLRVLLDLTILLIFLLLERVIRERYLNNLKYS